MKIAVSKMQRGYRSPPTLFRGQLVDSHDTPERLEALISIVTGRGHELCESPPISRALLEEVHDADFLNFLEYGPAQWRELSGSDTPLMPNIYPTRHLPAGVPTHPLAKAGFYLGDTVTPLVENTWAAVSGSAAAAAHAAQCVLDGENVAYALCRPSGHHAHRDMAQGFCYLNNAAIAAALCRRSHKRIAILDVDVHHGNGTQQIFYERSDVLTVSIHADTVATYPFYVGHADEIGAREGTGFNMNLPMPAGTSDEAYISTLDVALQKIRLFSPDALIVSLGLDAHEADRLGVFKLSTAGFEEIAIRIKAVGVPTVLIQEGGYTISAIGPTLDRFLSAFAKGLDRYAVRGLE